MAFAGMLALGIFVGGIVTLGLKLAGNSTADFIKIMGAVLTATFSGVVIEYMSKFSAIASDSKGAQSFFMYPIGLLVALLWLYFDAVWKQENSFVRYGGVFAIVLITIVAALLALVPRVRTFVG
jgi:hypothetical protein